MWQKLTRILCDRYGFKDMSKPQQMSCQQLVSSIEHHAALHLILEDDDTIPDKIGVFWTEIDMRVEFVPSVKCLDYRALTHSELKNKSAKHRTAEDIKLYMHNELELSKVSFGPVCTQFLRDMLEGNDIPSQLQDGEENITEAVIKGLGRFRFDDAIKCHLGSGTFLSQEQKENTWQLARYFYDRCPEANTSLLLLGLEEKFITLEEAIAEMTLCVGTDHPLILQCLKCVATQYWEDTDVALSLFGRCLDFCKEKLGAIHAETAMCHLLVGHLYLEKNDCEPAIDQFECAKRIVLKIHGETSREACGAYVQLQKAEVKRGYVEAAIVCARKARDIQIALTAPNHPESLKLTLALAQLLEKSIELDDARESFERYQECLVLLDQSLENSDTEEIADIQEQLACCVQSVIQLIMKSLSVKKQADWESKKRETSADVESVQIVPEKTTWTPPNGLKYDGIANYLQEQLDLCAGDSDADKVEAQTHILALLRWADTLSGNVESESIKEEMTPSREAAIQGE